MKAQLVFPIVYVLKLEDDCWYVGITMDLNKRLSQHWSEGGAKWTKLHKPVAVDKIIFPADADTIENDTTREYMEKYGKDKVRGGSYCRVE
jgi:predicted GIY-YIG superfamily endonuclease